MNTTTAFYVPLDDQRDDAHPRCLGWNIAGSRYALASGMTESAPDQRWAELIVEAFLSPPAESAHLWQLDQWVSAARAAWRRAVERGTAGYSIGSGPTSPAASFIGTVVEPDRSGSATRTASFWRWWAIAAGECSLFHLRPREDNGVLSLKGWLPLRAAAHFGVPDDRLGTIMAHRRELGPWISLHTGICLPGDMVVLATPALAHWILAEHEARRDLWVHLVSLPGEEADEFAEVVRDLQAAGEVAPQTTSLVVARIGAPPPPDEPGATATEERAQETSQANTTVTAMSPAWRMTRSRKRRALHDTRSATPAVFGGPIRCYRCGNDYALGAKRCRSCGAALSRLDMYRTWRKWRRMLRRLRRMLRRLLSWL